jgi:hypothetical protein
MFLMCIDYMSTDLAEVSVDDKNLNILNKTSAQ